MFNISAAPLFMFFQSISLQEKGEPQVQQGVAEQPGERLQVHHPGGLQVSGPDQLIHRLHPSQLITFALQLPVWQALLSCQVELHL